MYFSGNDVALVMADPFMELDAPFIQFQVTRSKLPIYGYKSTYFDTVADGEELVQGQLILNFKEAAQLSKHFKEAKLSDIASPAPNSDLLVGHIARLDIFYAPEATTLQGEAYEGNLNTEEYQHYVLLDIYIQSMEQSIASSSDPIGEAYTFIARSAGASEIKNEHGAGADQGLFEFLKEWSLEALAKAASGMDSLTNKAADAAAGKTSGALSGLRSMASAISETVTSIGEKTRDTLYGTKALQAASGLQMQYNYKLDCYPISFEMENETPERASYFGLNRGNSGFLNTWKELEESTDKVIKFYLDETSEYDPKIRFTDQMKDAYLTSDITWIETDLNKPEDGLSDGIRTELRRKGWDLDNHQIVVVGPREQQDLKSIDSEGVIREIAREKLKETLKSAILAYKITLTEVTYTWIVYNYDVDDHELFGETDQLQGPPSMWIFTNGDEILLSSDDHTPSGLIENQTVIGFLKGDSPTAVDYILSLFSGDDTDDDDNGA